MFTWFVIKGTDEQPAEEVLEQGLGRSQAQELGVGMAHPSVTWMCSQSLNLSEPCHLGFFIEASVYWHD